MHFNIYCLKKIYSILFLSLLLFNGVGYKLLVSYLQQNATQQLAKAIDEKLYDESDLIEIKTSLNMPYVADIDYQNVSGTIEIKNIHYQYVKRKIQDNVLYLLCLPNHTTTALAKSQSDVELGITKQNNQSDKQNNLLLILKKIGQVEYLLQASISKINQTEMLCLLVPKVTNSALTSLYNATTAEHPPQALV